MSVSSTQDQTSDRLLPVRRCTCLARVCLMVKNVMRPLKRCHWRLVFTFGSGIGHETASAGLLPVTCWPRVISIAANKSVTTRS